MSGCISIACMGDIMPGGIIHYENEDSFCNKELMQLLRNADIRVATLETAIGDKPIFDEEKMKRDKDVVYCPTSDLHRLVTLGINVVSLANNHAWDLGFEGIEHAKRELDKVGIKYCGAGANLDEASSPAVIDVHGKKIAFIAYCDNNPGTCGYIPIASTSSPGINALNLENIRQTIERLRNQYDYLFVIMHWGKEYYYYPMPNVRTLARKIIDWGADGIIGSHSHQIQPTVSYKEKPIIFSLGNFFFPDRVICPPRSTYYPEQKSDIANFPVTQSYPFVNEPTFKIWRKTARTGQLVTLTIDGERICIDRTLTTLDRQSHIGICHRNAPIMFKLSYYLVKLPLYSLLFFVLRSFRYIKKKVKGEI